MFAAIAAGADPAEADVEEALERLTEQLNAPLTRAAGMSREQYEWRVVMGLEERR